MARACPSPRPSAELLARSTKLAGPVREIACADAQPLIPRRSGDKRYGPRDGSPLLVPRGNE